MAETKSSRFEETRISSVVELLQLLRQHPALKFFRGQSNAQWQLVPRISRLYVGIDVPDTWERIESRILTEFQKFPVPYLSREPRSKFEWLGIGQHYGLPTRYLDWTTNPLKAMFFAVNDYANELDGALFAFSPTSHIPMLDDSESLDGDTHMITVFPKMIDSRVIAQEGCFTVFPLPRDQEQFQPLEGTAAHDGAYYLMIKMVIPKEMKQTFLYDLDILGVNERTLFPDLTGVSAYISRIHDGRFLGGNH